MVELKLAGGPRALIAMTGQKRSGKDTVAGFFVDEAHFEKVAFAGPLKGMIMSLFRSAGLSEEEAEERVNGSEESKEEALDVLQGKSSRFAMQKLGTEWRNFFGPHLWSDIVKAKVDSTDRVVLTDMRFLHESAFVRERDGFQVRVRRAGQKKGVDLHPSETEMEKIMVDATIYNHDSLQSLHAAAQLVLLASRIGSDKIYINFESI